MSEIETVFSKLGKDHDWIPIHSFKVPNRAMNFGDGLFETMVFDGNQLRFSNHHLARLSNGLKILSLSGEAVDIMGLEAFLNKSFQDIKLRVRWNVFRAGVGKYTPQTSETEQTIQVSRFTRAPQTKEIAFISDNIKLFPTVWSACKTMNSLPYVLANQERVDGKMDEVILLDHRGFLSEAGSSNLFWKKNGEYFTPSLDCSCLNGVARTVILEELIKQERQIQVGEFLPDVLKSADQIWVSNVSGISYLAQVGAKKYSTEPDPILQNLFE